LARIPVTFAPAIGESQFFQIQRRMSLVHFKWDSQIGDVCTLFRQPLLLEAEAWRQLSEMAEALAAELMSAEEELLERPDVQEILGIPRRLRKLFRQTKSCRSTPAAVRTLRFDFHYTNDGWRISEVNSDVPGGYTESSCFVQLMSKCFPGTRCAGDPAKAWTEAMITVVGEHGHVALLSAPGFLEDQQITAFLADQLQSRGAETFLLHHPSQLKWKSGFASVACGREFCGIDAIVRFYQGEWLANLHPCSEWEPLFIGGHTPVANPGTALLTETKRLPLAWNKLSSNMPTWRNLLPESLDPADASWQTDDDWVLKEAFSNTGDAVHVRRSMTTEAWKELCLLVKRQPKAWIAQRRFVPVPIESEAGEVFPCIGVYTVNGKAAGIYTRAALKPLIDFAAMDVATLIRMEESVGEGDSPSNMVST
jgi:glutathionylspermidine synthase